jgi:hypothetical protein
LIASAFGIGASIINWNRRIHNQFPKFINGAPVFAAEAQSEWDYGSRRNVQIKTQKIKDSIDDQFDAFQKRTIGGFFR